MEMAAFDRRAFKVTKPQVRRRKTENYKNSPATVSRPSRELWTDTTTNAVTVTTKTRTRTKEVDKRKTISQSVTNRKSIDADGAYSSSKTQTFLFAFTETIRYADWREMLFDEAKKDDDDDDDDDMEIDKIIGWLQKVKRGGGRCKLTSI